MLAYHASCKWIKKWKYQNLSEKHTTLEMAASRWKSVDPLSMLPLIIYANDSVTYCSIDMRASFSWMVPNESIRRPNCSRVVAWSTAFFVTARMVPARHAAIPKRPLFSMFIATCNKTDSCQSLYSVLHSHKFCWLIISSCLTVWFIQVL